MDFAHRIMADSIKPAFLPAIINAHPKRAFCGACVGQMLFVATVGLLILSGADVIPFSTKVPLYLRNHPTFEQNDMYVLGKEAANLMLSVGQAQRVRSQDMMQFELMFVAEPGENLLTPKHLRTMRAIEQQVLARGSYSAERCALVYPSAEDANTSSLVAVDEGACELYSSITHFYDPDFFILEPTRNRDSKFYQPAMVTEPVFNESNVLTINLRGAAFNGSFMGQTMPFAPMWRNVDANFGDGTAESSAVLATFSVGLPISNEFTSADDRYDEQIDVLSAWMFETYDKWGESTNTATSSMRVMYFDSLGKMNDHKMQEYLFRSVALIAGSILFVYLYMSLMNKSFFIGTLGMLSIFLSIFPTMLIYRYVYQQRYFGIFNVLAIFIIIGIG